MSPGLVKSSRFHFSLGTSLLMTKRRREPQARSASSRLGRDRKSGAGSNRCNGISTGSVVALPAHAVYRASPGEGGRGLLFMALTKGMLHMELTTHFKLGSQQPLIFQTQHMNLILISCFELKASRVSTHLRGNL